jgi:predicted MFS family arabinose efflux permease
MLENFQTWAWRFSWYSFGIVALFISLLCALLLRNSPGETIPSQDMKKQPMDKNNLGKQIYLSSKVWRLGIVYTAFGFSYIIYLTFFVKHLIKSFHYSGTNAGNLFMLMGWITVISGIAWGIVSDYLGRRRTLIILYLLQMTAFGLFGFAHSNGLLILSAVFFGITAWSIPAIMAAMCGDLLGPKLAPAALGFVTLFFGIGQALGPLAGGLIADKTGSFSDSFVLAGAISLLGALGAFFLLHPPAKMAKNQ